MSSYKTQYWETEEYMDQIFVENNQAGVNNDHDIASYFYTDKGSMAPTFRFNLHTVFTSFVVIIVCKFF